MENRVVDIKDVMHELQVGQVFTSGGKRFAFVEAKRTRVSAIEIETGKTYSVGGTITLTEEIQGSVKEEIKKKAIEKATQAIEVQTMSKGQHFIGGDGKEYIFVKFNRTRFEFSNLNETAFFNGLPGFVKEIK